MITYYLLSDDLMITAPGGMNPRKPAYKWVK